LGSHARALIADPANDVYVSAATVWEIAINRALGKLDAPPGLAAALAELGITEAPVTASDAELAGALQAHHRDPFDRVLVVQAARLDASVITRNPVFSRYGTATVPA
jgi:PIN domain nuclease of toxin-antitoxin system